MYEDLRKTAQLVLGIFGLIVILTAGWMTVGFFVGVSIRAARWVIGL